MDISFWSSAEQVAGTVMSAALVYVFAVVAVRVAGRRTVAQMNAFDIVVTVALGSLAASTALPSQPALSDGAAVLLTFLALQVLVAALRQRFPVVQRVLDFSPEILVRKGRIDLRRAPWTAQLVTSDLESKLRQQGVRDLKDATLVVLEPDGKITVTTADETPALFRDLAQRAS